MSQNTFTKANLFHRKKPRPESARICDMNYSMHTATVNLGRIPSAKCAEKKHLRVTPIMVINFPITLVMGLTIGTDDQNAISANRILLDIIFPFGNLVYPVGVVRYRRKPLCGGSRQPDDCLSVNVRACERRAIGRRTVSPPLTQRHHHRLLSHQHPCH